jgi:hypothetical protein
MKESIQGCDDGEFEGTLTDYCVEPFSIETWQEEEDLLSSDKLSDAYTPVKLTVGKLGPLL